MPLAKERLALVKLMALTVADQQTHGNFTYAAVRPQTIPPTYKTADKERLDCSDGVRFLCRVAGVKDDPAGNGYADYGNSRSIWLHLHRVELADVEPGDVFTFGYYSGEKHACQAWEFIDGEWLVWNLGTQGQPAKRRLVDEQAAHKGMAMTCLRLNVVDPPPTPADKLRAQTTWYAWVAWKLGEGPWKPFGKANPAVRPNVPKLIPAAWWANYTRFLAARKKGDKATS